MNTTYPYAADRGAGPNGLLAELSPLARADLLRQAKRHQLTVGQALPSGEAQVYLPESGLVSLLWSGPDGRIAETAVIDRSGAVGLVEALAGTPIGFVSRALTPGRGLLVPAAAARRLVETDAEVARCAWRWAANALRQARQGAACRALHTVHERLADQLLDYAERIGDFERLPVTHEVLSWSLGVCRTTVTTMVREFSNEGLIATARSRIAICDLEGMDAAACGCRKSARLSASSAARRPAWPTLPAAAPSVQA